MDYISTSDEEDNDSDGSSSDEELEKNAMVHDVREFEKGEESKDEGKDEATGKTAGEAEGGVNGGNAKVDDSGKKGKVTHKKDVISKLIEQDDNLYKRDLQARLVKFQIWRSIRRRFNLL